MPEAGVVGVVLAEAALGPGRGCSTRGERFASPTRGASQEREEQRAAPGHLSRLPRGAGGCAQAEDPWRGTYGGANPILPGAERSPLLPFSPGISTDK